MNLIVLIIVVTILAILFGLGITVMFFVFIKREDKSHDIPCNEPDFGIHGICFNCGVHESEHNL